MPPKLRSAFRCAECGYFAPKPYGQCPQCSAWNSMMEEAVAPGAAPAAKSLAADLGLTSNGAAEPLLLSQALEAGKGEAEEPRARTGMPELDRLLGGGLVAGQAVLVAGPPGIGKSTLALQAAARLSAGAATLYVSGEESQSQVLGRARRLGIKGGNAYLLAETDLSKILLRIKELRPRILVLDSIQTVFHPEVPSQAGSLLQVRDCALELVRLAKGTGMMLLVLGHVTKDGFAAGPRMLEHMVDTVLYFEPEREGLVRVLRAVKNRFGPTDEIGLFEMSGTGLQDIEDPARLFAGDAGEKIVSGRASSVSLEGSRPLLARIESLVVATKYPLPRRMAQGVDLNRVLVLLAAMEKHLRLKLEGRDVFVAVAGGLKIKDPALDLAVCLSILSSARDVPLAPDWALLGEVGLSGELGGAPGLELRLKEAVRSGVKRALIPSRRTGKRPAASFRIPGLEVSEASDLETASRIAFENQGGNS